MEKDKKSISKTEALTLAIDVTLNDVKDFKRKNQDFLKEVEHDRNMAAGLKPGTLKWDAKKQMLVEVE